jgi:PEP-CTERM motif
MKRFLLASVLAAAPFAAHATLVSSASGGGLLAGSCGINDGGTGFLSVNCPGNGSIFTSLNITASGVPLLPSPDLTTTTLTIAASGNGTLTAKVLQSAIPSYTGPVQVTLTVNDLIGNDVGPLVLSADAPDGTPIFTHSFGGSGTMVSGSIPLSSIVQDSAIFSLTFTGVTPGNPESVDATIEINRLVPEPASLALLGVGLLGTVAFARRRRA